MQITVIQQLWLKCVSYSDCGNNAEQIRVVVVVVVSTVTMVILMNE